MSFPGGGLGSLLAVGEELLAIFASWQVRVGSPCQQLLVASCCWQILHDAGLGWGCDGVW